MLVQMILENQRKAITVATFKNYLSYQMIFHLYSTIFH